MNQSLQQKIDTQDSLIKSGILCLKNLVFCVLFMPLIVTPSTFFPFVVGKAVYSRILIEMAVILWIPLMVLKRSLRPSKNSIIIALSIYIFVSILSSLFGVGGEKRPATTTSTVQTKIPTELSPFVKEVLGEAQALYKADIERGYDPYTGQMIAPLTAEEQRAMEGISGLVGTIRKL